MRNGKRQKKIIKVIVILAIAALLFTALAPLIASVGGVS